VRHFVCLLLGVWMGGILLLNVVATRNLASVDSVVEIHLGNSEDAKSIKRLGGAEATRVFLRRVAAEKNRDHLVFWGWAQSGLSLMIVLGTHEGKLPMLVSLLMLVLVLAQVLVLGPSIVSLGREMDYLDQIQDVAGIQAQFNIRHVSYIILEILKVGGGVTLAGFMMQRRSYRRRSGDKDDSGQMKRRNNDK
jgi:hypothetical protein